MCDSLQPSLKLSYVLQAKNRRGKSALGGSPGERDLWRGNADQLLLLTTGRTSQMAGHQSDELLQTQDMLDMEPRLHVKRVSPLLTALDGDNIIVQGKAQDL